MQIVSNIGVLGECEAGLGNFFGRSCRSRTNEVKNMVTWEMLSYWPSINYAVEVICRYEGHFSILIREMAEEVSNR